MLGSAYEFVPLDIAKATLYEKLTYPIFRPRLGNLIPNSSMVAVGVHSSSKPAGLVLAECNRSWGEILSLFVVPEHRHCGLGKALLSSIEQEIYRRGCSQAKLIYMASDTTPYLEQILARCNWSAPQPRMLVGSSTCMSGDNTPLVSAIKDCLNRYFLPPAFSLFPWMELTSLEREAIQKQQGNLRWYPDILCPFKEEDIIEPCNSLGLRYQDQVVGWVITHRVAVDTVRYTSLFVRQDLQRLGRAIPLLLTSFLLQSETKEATKAVFTVAVDNTPMIRFVHRRISPYLASVRQSWESSKLLVPNVLME